MRSFDLSTTRSGAATAVVAVKGSVDAVTAPRLTEALDAEIEAGRIELVVDLGGVDYASSACLRSVLATLKRVRAQGGDLRLAALQPPVRSVFELAGLTGIVRLFDRRDDAVASFA